MFANRKTDLTEQRRPHTFKLEGNEFRVGIAAIALVTLILLATFRPGAAHVIPLGLAPELITPSAPTTPARPDPAPRTSTEGIQNVETGAWLNLGANAPDAADQTQLVNPESHPNWSAPGNGCPETDPWFVPFCFELSPAGGVEPDRSVLTVGNSHSVQFTSAFLETMDRRPNWSIRTMASPGCPFSYVPYPKSDCERLWTIATQYIQANQPDMVAVLATRSSVDGPENLLPGLAEWIRMIEDTTSSQVVALRDTPRFAFDMYKCAEKYGTSSDHCVVHTSLDPLLDQEYTLERAGAAYIDVNASVCPDSLCRPVIGGVWTYLDENHPSADYWRTLANQVATGITRDPDFYWWPKLPYLGDKRERPSAEVRPVT